MARSRSTFALRHRGGFSYRGLLIVLAVVIALPVIAWFVLPRLSSSAQEAGVMMHTVERGEFIHEITDRGEVESACNVEIRCEVKATNKAGNTILEIVPEGTQVQPGDLLVKLDSSGLENDRTRQQIICNNSKAAVIQAQNILDTAEITKEEYLGGKYKQEVQEIQSEIFVAEENLRRAQEYLQYSERLAAKGYVTALQLEADRFAVEKARNELDLAGTKLDVLAKFTKKKMLKQLEADIETAKAKLQAEQDSHKLDVQELQRIENEIVKCTVRVSEPGQVVYANVTGGRGRNEVIIEEGTVVRERQVIIRLPDPTRMQVKARINESKVTLLEEGMPVTIRLDAFPDYKLQGTVERIDELPAPTSWFSSNIKEYETIIRIHDPPPDLRPGLTAEVKIEVERLSDVLRVPVQTVFEHDGRYFCVVADGQGFKARQVELGSTNDKFVIIRKGLEAGRSIALNAAAYRDKVDLPDPPPVDRGKPKVADRRRRVGSGTRPTGGKRPAGGPQPGAAP